MRRQAIAGSEVGDGAAEHRSVLGSERGISPAVCPCSPLRGHAKGRSLLVITCVGEHHKIYPPGTNVQKCKSDYRHPMSKLFHKLSLTNYLPQTTEPATSFPVFQLDQAMFKVQRKEKPELLWRQKPLMALAIEALIYTWMRNRLRRMPDRLSAARFGYRAACRIASTACSGVR